jgi:hypothetical protein
MRVITGLFLFFLAYGVQVVHSKETNTKQQKTFTQLVAIAMGRMGVPGTIFTLKTDGFPEGAMAGTNLIERNPGELILVIRIGNTVIEEASS